MIPSSDRSLIRDLSTFRFMLMSATPFDVHAVRERQGTFSHGTHSLFQLTKLILAYKTSKTGF